MMQTRALYGRMEEHIAVSEAHQLHEEGRALNAQDAVVIVYRFALQSFSFNAQLLKLLACKMRDRRTSDSPPCAEQTHWRGGWCVLAQLAHQIVQHHCIGNKS